MFCPCQADRRTGDEGVARQSSVTRSMKKAEGRTLCSTNLLIVARMSWCPDTSSRVFGLYFSTLDSFQYILHTNISLTAYHGRLSSASTGKSATIRFPFVAVLSELNLIERSGRGPSTSISSSKSDILSS